MRILGIDFGDRRIGIAISDPFGWTAQALETIDNKSSNKNAIKRILEIINEYEAEKIVLGFPKNMNGTVGERGEKTIKFKNILESEIKKNKNINNSKQKIEIIIQDERLTSVSANRAMTEMGVKTSQKKGIVDQISAVYILQTYLDSNT